MAKQTIATCGTIACESAGVPPELATQLVWETPPIGVRVKMRAWKRAREVFAIGLVQLGWEHQAVADCLGVTPVWVGVTCEARSVCPDVLD
jgi:hypothetical protein